MADTTEQVNRDVYDLQLILFSGLLPFFMIAGTIWILASLGTRTT